MTITHAQKSPRFKKLHLFGNIVHRGLLAELVRRRIPEPLAAKYLYQIYVQEKQQPNRKLHGFALANDAGGFAVSIPDAAQSLNVSLHPDAPTTFRARASKKLFVFEGMWDFLSWMEMQDTPEPEHNIIVLNLPSFYGPITDQIIAAREQIDTVLLFMNNSDDGQQIAQYMDEQLANKGFTTRTMESLYQGYRSLSDYWCKDQDARKITEQKEAAKKYYTDDSAWSLVMNRNRQK